jgi:hypothetical protein
MLFEPPITVRPSATIFDVRSGTVNRDFAARTGAHLSMDGTIN